VTYPRRVRSGVRRGRVITSGARGITGFSRGITAFGGRRRRSVGCCMTNGSRSVAFPRGPDVRVLACITGGTIRSTRPWDGMYTLPHCAGRRSRTSRCLGACHLHNPTNGLSARIKGWTFCPARPVRTGALSQLRVLLRRAGLPRANSSSLIRRGRRRLSLGGIHCRQRFTRARPVSRAVAPLPLWTRWVSIPLHHSNGPLGRN